MATTSPHFLASFSSPPLLPSSPLPSLFSSSSPSVLQPTLRAAGGRVAGGAKLEMAMHTGNVGAPQRKILAKVRGQEHRTAMPLLCMLDYDFLYVLTTSVVI